ncbi:hypothetical protein MRB53_033544 [Persea americana]|uniref:Uncharacterized protein n=1 Tax=Persea americana TaxID=3435 RepID=A0ACC2KUU7_PERAE|nr:hypothetical protein MRB53_033544 [Persea americana]
MHDWNVDCGTLFHYLLDHPEPLRRTFLKMIENPFLLSKSQGRRDEWKRGFHIREDEDCVYLRIEMPGLGKEDVEVSVDRNSLIIRGQGEKESEDDDESGRSYKSRIGFGFLRELYKLDQIKGEMKNTLRLSVPKVKEEEEKTKDVFEVKIE